MNTRTRPGIRSTVTSVVLACAMFFSILPIAAPTSAFAAPSDLVNVADLHTGDKITFGSYPQTVARNVPGLPATAASGTTTIAADGHRYRYVDSEAAWDDDWDQETEQWAAWYRFEPITWVVLQNTGSQVLLFADKVLDNQDYHFVSEAVQWENSNARSWLNGLPASANLGANGTKDGREGVDYTSADDSFIGLAFNVTEQALIATTHITTPANGVQSGGPDSDDKLFYLSIDEATRTAWGFPADPTATLDGSIPLDQQSPNLRVTWPTDYAIANDTYRYPNFTNLWPYLKGSGSWGLRSPGNVNNNKMTYIQGGGQINQVGTYPFGVSAGTRPALYLQNLQDLLILPDGDGGYVAQPSSTHSAVSFDTHDGEYVPSIAVKTGTAIGQLPTATRAGYYFDGWFDAQNGGNEITAEHVVVAEETLHAQWTPIPQVTVTFDTHGGGAVSPVVLYEHTAIGTLPVTTKAGYTFQGWFTAETGGDAVDETHIVHVSETLHAQWVQVVTPPDDGKQPTQTETPVAAGNIPQAGGATPVTPGVSVKLPVTVDFGGGFADDVTWSAPAASDTTGVSAVTAKYGYDIGTAPAGAFTLSADGTLKATGTGEGRVTLTATSKSDPTKTVSITVVIAKNVTKLRTPVTKLYLKKSSKAVAAPALAFDGKTAAGKAFAYGETAKVTWKVTSGAKYVSVNAQTGKITPKKPGTAKVTVTSLDGTKLTFTVKVVKKAKKLSKVTLSKPPKTLKNGATKQLKVKLSSAKATNVKVTYKTSKSSVLKVDKAGKLFAIKKGKAKITVKAGGKKKTYTIKVK